MLAKPNFSSMYAALLTGVLISFALAGCPATMNPHAAAAQAAPENAALTQAYATYGEWTIVHEQTAELICGPASATSKCPGNPAIAQSVVRAVQEIDTRATAAQQPLLDSIALVARIQAAIAAGATPEEKLEIANANLIQWTTELQKLIAAIKTTTGR